MDWSQRRNSLNAFDFRRRYRIDKDGFDEVLSEIDEELPVVVSNAVPNELKLSMTLRYLAGGSYLRLLGSGGRCLQRPGQQLRLAADAVRWPRPRRGSRCLQRVAVEAAH